MAITVSFLAPSCLYPAKVGGFTSVLRLSNGGKLCHYNPDIYPDRTFAVEG